MVQYNARSVLAKRKATVVATFSKPSKKRPLIQRRVVQFVEARNEYHADNNNNNNNSHDDLTTKATWHSKASLKAMEAAAVADARDLKLAEKCSTTGKSSWSRSLYRIHRALQQTEDISGDAAVIAAAARTVVLPVQAMGLENVVIAPVSRDFAARRQVLLAQIKWIGQQSKWTADQRAAATAAAVHHQSRVSASYAAILGHAHAKTQHEC